MELTKEEDLIGAEIIGIEYEKTDDKVDISEIRIVLKDGREATILGTGYETLSIECWEILDVNKK